MGYEDRDPIDDEPMPTLVPQRLMNVVAVLVVLALILGSAGIIVALTDWGIDAAATIGLVIAAVLLIAWLRLPGRQP